MTHVSRDSFAADVVAGLRETQKTLPARYFYDQRGSELFDRICDLPEYYPTRTEMAIMQRHGAEMARMMTADISQMTAMVELGSGSSWKTRILLDALPELAAYIPVDISGEHLQAAADRLATMYRQIEVLPVCADYTEPVTLPTPNREIRRTVVYFPGSTLGNFHEAEARDFLKRWTTFGEAMLIGIDLRKDPADLVRAYDDAQGVTAAFNLNLLRRLNRELDGSFDMARFDHRAVWNDHMSRVEMHLVSRGPQQVRVAGHQFEFSDGESIRTEVSYKYTLAGFAELAAAAGWRVERVWMDDDKRFSVQYLDRN